MAQGTLYAMYFSPTGTTQKVVAKIGDTFSTMLAQKTTYIDFTLPLQRQKQLVFTKDDVLILGIPVYAGRVPNVLLNFLNSLEGNGAAAVVVTVYGNRNYDDALLELKDILTNNLFTVFAGAAFIGEHSFSTTLAQNRPDEKDLQVAVQFAKMACEKFTQKAAFPELVIKGCQPYRKYYMPKKPNGEPADIRKVTPKTSAACTHCKKCVAVCPMGSIDAEDVAKVNGICIKCGACIKRCPTQAKYYDDANYLRHKEELEIQFADRREPELFI